jgi:hypothetical protein
VIEADWEGEVEACWSTSIQGKGMDFSDGQ